MGTRFRKSINLGGGAKLNLSKSGVGYSFGTKGARITKTAKGTTRTTLSVPGTGISYVSETGAKSTRKGGEKEMDSKGGTDYMEVIAQIEENNRKRREALDSGHCPKCGGLVNPGEKYCQSCGEQLIPDPEPPKPDKWKSKPVKVVRWLLVLVILVYLVLTKGFGKILVLGSAACAAPIKFPSKITRPVRAVLLVGLLVVAVAVFPAFPGNSKPAEIAEEPSAATESVVREVPSESTIPETTIPETTVPETTIPETTVPATTAPATNDYVVNKKSKKFHNPFCKSVNEIDPGNRSDMNATRADMIARGYSPCGSCKP